jgi:hypothetical protein
MTITVRKVLILIALFGALAAALPAIAWPGVMFAVFGYFVAATLIARW